MKYYGLQLQPMQESGAFLLRALQNEETPLLDLLVRESVQNALDAGRNGDPTLPVSVDFHIREHSLDSISSTFGEGLDLEVLAERYRRSSKLLEIRDSDTEGLTGPMTFDSVGGAGQHGNFLKLVFEIGRTRADDGAGGSWGLGKTCYFRMGVGLVIYYSRIRTAEGYEERLVASLVEDESRVDRLQVATQTGIAWWGSEEALKAITEPELIHEILDSLGTQPFTDSTTGTAIIIPMLRENLLPFLDRESGPAPWWCRSYQDYVNVAVQRWFSARLDNPFFASGRYLKASVNNRDIASSDMLPIFQASQSLYDRAIGEASEAQDYLTMRGVKPDQVLCRAIHLRNEFLGNGHAGWLLAVAMTPRQLQMDAPDNGLSPEVCIFNKVDNGAPHRPIVTFMRSPGMNICWDDSIDSRSWSGGFSGFVDGRYVVALFLPDSEQELMPSAARGLRSTVQNLGGYLRSCERADHAAWVDVNGGRIVEKIRAQCGRALKEFGVPPQPSVTVKPSMRMSRKLAELVLDRRGFGGDGRYGKASPSPALGQRSKGSAQRTPELEIIEIRYVASAIVMKWSLSWGVVQPGTPRVIAVSVDSESGPITMDKWHESGLVDFPFRLESFRITSAIPSVKVTEVAEGTGIRIAVATLSARTGLILEGELQVSMTRSGGHLLRPVIGVHVAGIDGAAK